MSGPEIWKDTAGKVDFFVTAAGTGGTLSGVGRYLKIKNPSINIVCVEPSESAVISGNSVLSLCRDCSSFPNIMIVFTEVCKIYFL